MATLLELAQLSKMVYGDSVTPPLNSNWTLLESYAGEGNGYFGQAYQNRITKEIVITNRGTRFASLDDYFADIKLTAGVITPEQVDAVRFAKKVANNPDYNYSSIVETGHSKGGNEAQAATATLTDAGYNVSAVTFNAPGIGGYPVGNGAYDVLNVYTQGDVIHLAGGAQLGRSMEIPAGPDNSKLSFALPIVAATGGGAALALFAKIIWNALVPAHSIDTVINYLAGDSLGESTWPQAGPPVALAGDTSNSWATVDTDGSFTLTDGAGNTFSYSTDSDGSQTYGINTQDAGSCTYTITSGGSTTERSISPGGVTSTRTVDTDGNISVRNLDANGGFGGIAWDNADGSGGLTTTSRTDYNSVIKSSDGSLSYTSYSMRPNPSVGSFTSTINADNSGRGASNFAGGILAGAWSFNGDGSVRFMGNNKDGSLAYDYVINAGKAVTYTRHQANGDTSSGTFTAVSGSGTGYKSDGSKHTWFFVDGTLTDTSYAPDGTLIETTSSSSAGPSNVETGMVVNFRPDGAISEIYSDAAFADIAYNPDGSLSRIRINNPDGATNSVWDGSTSTVWFTADGSSYSARFDNADGGGTSGAYSNTNNVSRGLYTPIGRNTTYLDGSLDTYLLNGDGSSSDVAYRPDGSLASTTYVNADKSRTNTAFVETGWVYSETYNPNGNMSSTTSYDPDGSYIENAYSADGSHSEIDYDAYGIPTTTIVVNSNGDSTLTGGDSSNTLTGGAGADTLNGGAGSDILDGGNGSDTYVFDVGGGIDTIQDSGIAGTDTLAFGQAITQDSLSLGLGSLLIKVGAGSDAIHIKNFDPNNVYGSPNIENFKFADGTVLTYNLLVSRGFDIKGSVGNDTLNGTNVVDRLYGLNGNDTIYGIGGVDTLAGGTGDDLLVGGYDRDIYLFNLGDGSDTIDDAVSYAHNGGYGGAYGGGYGNELRFGAGISPNQIAAISDNGALTLTVQGTSDSIRLLHWVGGLDRVNSFVFPDGTVWDAAHVESMLAPPNIAPRVLAPIGRYDATQAQAIAFRIPDGTFHDANPADTLTLSVQLEDGNQLPPWLSFDAATHTLSGTPGNGEVGAYSIRVTASDPTGASVADVFDLVVANVNDAPVVALPVSDQTVVENAGFNYTLPAGTFTDVDLGDRLTLSATLATGNPLPSWLKFDAASASFSGSPGIGNLANYAIRVTASDVAGATTAATFNLSVVAAPGVSLLGTAGANSLTGLSGNDTLNGGAGADTLIGGKGDDTYHVDNTKDKIVERKDEGMDTAVTSVDYRLPDNVETLTLTGKSGLKGTGNDLDNTFWGSSGKDTLAGGKGDDTYHVDSAKDKIVERKNEGKDTIIADIDYTLPDYVENLVLTGASGRKGTGNTLDNSLSGTAGNDSLDGDSGADTLKGGAGNDSYYVDNVGDRIVELAGAGIDSVVSGVSYTLPDNVENLTLTDGKNSGDQHGGEGNDHKDGGRDQESMNGTGNALANTIVGDTGANTLDGRDGNDMLTGGKSNDTLYGGIGDDILNGGAGNDGIDGNAGLDFLEGMAGNDTLSDTTGSGYFSGGTGDDKLAGGAMADFFLGGRGDDTINTGGGDDVIVFNHGDGHDMVTVGANARETISLGGDIEYRDLKFKKSGNNLVLTTGDEHEGIEFVNWYAGSANRNVLNLQVVAEAMDGFNARSTDALFSKKVQNFDFKGLAGAFDAARAAKPGLSSWALTSALTQFHLASSDSSALGGDLAYQYGKNGTLSGIGLAAAQELIGDAQFGAQAQALKPLSGLREGAVRLS